MTMRIFLKDGQVIRIEEAKQVWFDAHNDPGLDRPIHTMAAFGNGAITVGLAQGSDRTVLGCFRASEVIGWSAKDE